MTIWSLPSICTGLDEEKDRIGWWGSRELKWREWKFCWWKRGWRPRIKDGWVTIFPKRCLKSVLLICCIAWPLPEIFYSGLPADSCYDKEEFDNLTNYVQMIAWSSLILIDICISPLHAEKARGTTLKRLLFNKTIVDLSSKKWSIESRYLSNKCSQQNQTRDTVLKTLLKNKNYKKNKIII